MVGKYMDDGGKALIEIDPQTDPQLDNIFHAWNINVGSNVVVDARASAVCSAPVRKHRWL